MEYTKVNCRIQPDNEINREILVAELGSIGFESFTESEEVVEAYIPTATYSTEKLEHLFLMDFTAFQFSFTSETIPDQNWNEVWEKNYFKPLMVAERCLVRAPFHTEYPENAEYEIVIEPGMAFGTGNHETTSLMIAEILKEDLEGKKVLDMGCGTGILSILASMRGAKTITAIDIDGWAVKSTLENAAYNQVYNIEVFEGGTDVLPDQTYDFIFANIHRNVLLNDMPQYRSVLNRGAELIMSGIYTGDQELIKERAAQLGLQYKRVAENNGWVAVTFTLR